MLALVPTGADAEVQATAGQLGHRGGAFGEQRGVMERQRADERAEADAAGVRGEPRERGPGVERRALGMAEEAGEMIGAKERLEPTVFRGPREPPPAVPREPFLAFDHQADADGHTRLHCRNLPAPVS